MLPGTTDFVASVGNPAYDNPMAKAHKFDLETPAPILDDEDEETRVPHPFALFAKGWERCCRGQPFAT